MDNCVVNPIVGWWLGLLDDMSDCRMVGRVIHGGSNYRLAYRIIDGRSDYRNCGSGHRMVCLIIG